jgi:hypothetical protein
MRNQFSGFCFRCGDSVRPGDGHFQKAGSGNRVKWLVQHKDCAIRWRGAKPPPTKEEARLARAKNFKDSTSEKAHT